MSRWTLPRCRLTTRTSPRLKKATPSALKSRSDSFRDFNADGVAFFSLGDVLVVNLHRGNVHLDIRGVSLNVNLIAHFQRTCHIDTGDDDMSKEIAYLADLFFLHCPPP